MTQRGILSIPTPTFWKQGYLHALLIGWTVLACVQAERNLRQAGDESGSSSASASDSGSGILDEIENAVTSFHASEGILAGIAIGAGLFVCFLGYRLVRPTLFICGFVLGGSIAVYIKDQIKTDTSWWDLIAFLIGGVIVGVLVLVLYKLGIFLLGAAGGVALGVLVNTSIAPEVYPSHPEYLLIILCAIFGLIFGCLALYIEKIALIITTSIAGGVAVVWGIGQFAGEYPSVSDLKSLAENVDGETVYNIPDAWWGYLAGSVVLSALGMFVQFRQNHAAK